MCFYKPNKPPCTCTFVQLIQPCSKAVLYPSPTPSQNPNPIVKVCGNLDIAKGVGQRYCSACDKTARSSTAGSSPSVRVHTPSEGRRMSMERDVQNQTQTQTRPDSVEAGHLEVPVPTWMKTEQLRAGPVRRTSEERQRSTSRQASVAAEPYDKTMRAKRTAVKEDYAMAGSVAPPSTPEPTSNEGHKEVAPPTPRLEGIPGDISVEEEELDLAHTQQVDLVKWGEVEGKGQGQSCPGDHTETGRRISDLLSETEESGRRTSDLVSEGGDPMKRECWEDDDDYSGRRLSDLFSDEGYPVDQELDYEDRYPVAKMEDPVQFKMPIFKVEG